MAILEPLKGIIIGDLGTSLKHVYNIILPTKKIWRLGELMFLNCVGIVKKNLNSVLSRKPDRLFCRYKRYHDLLKLHD